MCGARVIATSSSDAKIERLKQLGADFTLNYKATPDWGKKAREWSGHGVDLVVEVGGVGTLNESIRATRIGGTIAFIGVLAGPPTSDSRLPLMVMQQKRLQGGRHPRLTQDPRRKGRGDEHVPGRVTQEQPQLCRRPLVPDPPERHRSARPHGRVGRTRGSLERRRLEGTAVFQREQRGLRLDK